MRYIGPKDRISRREGVDIFGKKVARLNVPPGVHGPKGLGKRSEFGRQLREKQKAKRIYGVSEKQFSAYVEISQKHKNLTQVLERRLDNVVYRLGFAPTRPSARQVVSHRHVLVNGKILNIPSYSVSEDDTVALDAKAQKIAEIRNRLDSNSPLPTWLERQGAVGRIKRLPIKEDVQEPFSEQEIIEFYSR